MSKLSVLALSVIVLSAAGCQRKDADGTSSGGPGGGKVKIVYIPKNTGNPYFDEVVKGFEEGAKEAGAEFFTTAPATAEATSQIPIIKEQIQRGVDVIAISANSPDALNQVLDQARQRGITIITVDSDLAGNESHRDAAVLPTDFSKIGPAQVELLGSQIGYEGEIAILSATTDAPNQNAWIAKMKETLAESKYSKMKLVDLVYGDDEPQKSTTECEALLSKHPQLKGVISPTSVGLAAAAQVFELNKPKGVQLTGLSTPNQLKKFVKSGVVTGFQLWSPRDEGYLAAQLAVQIRSKKVTPTPGATLETPKLGKSTFTNNLELHAGPLVTFDKSNIDKYDF